MVKGCFVWSEVRKSGRDGWGDMVLIWRDEIMRSRRSDGEGDLSYLQLGLMQWRTNEWWPHVELEQDMREKVTDERPRFNLVVLDEIQTG